MSKVFTELQRENLGFALSELFDKWAEEGVCTFDPYDSDNIDAVIDVVEKEVL